MYAVHSPFLTFLASCLAVLAPRIQPRISLSFHYHNHLFPLLVAVLYRSSRDMIENAVLILDCFLHCVLETRWQRFGQFLNDFLNDFLNNFLYENLNFLCENLRFSL